MSLYIYAIINFGVQNILSDNFLSQNKQTNKNSMKNEKKALKKHQLTGEKNFLIS